MKFILLLFLLASCAKPASETVAQNAITSVDNLYNSIPKECITESLSNLHTESIKQIQGIVSECKKEKAILQAKISDRNTIIVVLLFLIGLYVGVLGLSKIRQ